MLNILNNGVPIRVDTVKKQKNIDFPEKSWQNSPPVGEGMIKKKDFGYEQKSNQCNRNPAV